MKHKNENHSHNSLFPKSPASKWGINFGKIKTKSPLNCKCGSKNLQYLRKKADIWAECRDCGGKFQVSSALSPYLQHLVAGGEK